MAMSIEALYTMWAEEELPPEQRTLDQERARVTAETLYQEAQDSLLGIPQYERQRAEGSWREDQSGGWVNITLPAGNNEVFETYQHPRCGVLSIDLVRIYPSTGLRQTIDNAEVRTGTRRANPWLREPHFNHIGSPNTVVAATSFRDFIANIKDRRAA